MIELNINKSHIWSSYTTTLIPWNESKIITTTVPNLWRYFLRKTKLSRNTYIIVNSDFNKESHIHNNIAVRFKNLFLLIWHKATLKRSNYVLITARHLVYCNEVRVNIWLWITQDSILKTAFYSTSDSSMILRSVSATVQQSPCPKRGSINSALGLSLPNSSLWPFFMQLSYLIPRLY